MSNSAEVKKRIDSILNENRIQTIEAEEILDDFILLTERKDQIALRIIKVYSDKRLHSKLNQSEVDEIIDVLHRCAIRNLKERISELQKQFPLNAIILEALNEIEVLYKKDAEQITN